MTNILALPLVSFTATTTNNADWNDAISFANNGAPIDLTGIAFRMDWRKQSDPSSKIASLEASTENGYLVNGGASGVLAMNVPVAVMASIPPGAYLTDIIAIADGRQINLGQAAPSVVTHNQGMSE